MCGAPGRPIVPSRGLRVLLCRMLIPIAATASAAALGAWAYGTYEPNGSLFGRAVGRGPTRERVAYLTFDDGPNPGATEPILETLAASDVPAAFFLVGEHVRRFPKVARRVAAAGHEVGNHTLRHQKLHFRGPRRIRGARAHARVDRRHDGPGPTQLPCASRLPQPVRRRRHPTSRLHGVRLDVRRVGLGPPCVGRGDPCARAPQAPTGCHHPVARRRWLRSGRRPAPYRGRAPGDHRGCAVRGIYLAPARRAGPVKSRAGRWLGWLLALVGVGLALKFFTGFPWQVTFAALLGADRWLLVVALAVNLSSLVAKGWGWHLILKPVAPHSWRVAQEANLVGAAVNDLSVAVAGEAARVHLIVQRGGVQTGAAVSSVVWTRVAEGLALALFLVMAPSVLQLEPWLRAVQSAVGLALVVVLLLAWGRGWGSLADRLPASLRSRLAVLRTMGAGGRLLWPTAFALYNWAAQWATYHLVLRATHVPVSLAASFTALIVVNLGGLLRPTPANIGVTQAALVVGLLPFGVAPENAVAAGLALQGLQVLPVLFLGAMVTGWRLLRLESELA